MNGERPAREAVCWPEEPVPASVRSRLMRTAVLLAASLAIAGCGGAPDVAGPRSPVGLAAGPSAGPATQDGACPAVYPAVDGPWVPEVPSADTGGRLVPDADPVLAHICRYAPRQNSGDAVALGLVGEADVLQGLGAVRSDLHLPALLEGAGRSCTAIGGDLVPHLVRFDYADGSVWVSAAQEPNRCTDSGNGAFITGVQLGDRLATALDTGRWPAGPQPAGCFSGAGGRAGQEQQLVPVGWTSMTVCQPGLNTTGPPPRVLDATTADRVAAMLEEADLAPGSGGCSGVGDTRFDVLVGYPGGNAVMVGVNIGCDPPLRNGSLDGVLVAGDQAALAALLRGTS